ncbi:amidohydrolase [Alteromonas oceanisediminis]|uniref:amidohydrolase n=1 Tax=Alteromonas oceanisediminis TaxID=2836180 RepID=UPI001BDA5D93|nr:amidohydrolase [Alteromonas oceanisediminis]MBT0585893.1 amidohydrolase [Alteromonas oceanisediminis]
MHKPVFFTLLRSATIGLLSVVCVASHAATHYFNINGYTFDSNEKLVTFSNMIVEDGKVVSIGNTALGHGFPTAEQVDVGGKTLLPGLIDAHGHLLGLGATLLEIDVRDASSAEHAAKMTAQYYAQNPALEWVTGRGWNQVLWADNTFPNAQILDEQLQNVPVWLERVDGHAGWANSAALKLAGIDSNSVSPEGGKILTDDEGKPTGVLIDTAMSLVERHIPTLDDSMRQRQLAAVGEHLLALGITSMHDAGIDKATYDFYLASAKSNALPLRVYAMLSASSPELGAMLDAGKVTREDDMLLIRSVKAYGDGALGSRGAALLQPYADDPHNHGLLVTPQEKLPALFDTVIGADFALHFHAIGDRANRLALDHFAKTFETVGGKDLRHRIEHAQVIALDDIPRFKTLGIIPSMQPTHATSDKNMAQDRIGAERLKGAYAWRTFLAQGSRLAFGSDFPVELANPFFGLHAAVTRQDRNNQPVDGWVPSQALTITEAFKAFTLDAAYAATQEDKIGRLQPGQWADFIIVDQDIFAIDSQDIWKTNVLSTTIAGEKVFSTE